MQATSTPTPPRSPLGEVLPDVVTGVPGWQAVAFVLFLVGGIVVSKYAIRLLGRPIARRFVRQSVAQTILRATRIGIFLLFAFSGAGALGFELGDIVLSVTVFSAVLGIVLAPIVGSIVNGLFVLADQPYEIGDMVELPDGTTGFVDDITLRYTKVITVDNTFAVIPNSVIRESKVTNFSAEDERTRLTLPIVVTYESDIPQARRLIERSAAGCESVIEGGPDIRVGSARYPARPTCYIDEYGDHGVKLTLRYWARMPYKLLTVRSQVQTALWDALDDDDVPVEVAYPHSHLVFDDTSGTARVSIGSEGGSEHRSGAATDRQAGSADGAPGDLSGDGG